MADFNIKVSLKLITRCYVKVNEINEFVQKLHSCGYFTYVDSDGMCEDEEYEEIPIMIFQQTLER